MQREDWDRRYSDVDLLWSRDPNRFLVAEAEDLAPGRALDLACGEGRNAIWLAELGWQVTGVDYSGVAIAKARERAASARLDIEFISADLLEYEPEPSAFDLVALFYLQIPVDERRIGAVHTRRHRRGPRWARDREGRARVSRCRGRRSPRDRCAGQSASTSAP